MTLLTFLSVYSIVGTIWAVIIYMNMSDEIQELEEDIEEYEKDLIKQESLKSFFDEQNMNLKRSIIVIQDSLQDYHLLEKQTKKAGLAQFEKFYSFMNDALTKQNSNRFYQSPFELVERMKKQ